MGCGEEPWDPRCSGHAWAVLRVLRPEKRPVFLGSRAQLVLEMGQFDSAEARPCREVELLMLNWAVSPCGCGLWQPGHAQVGGAGGGWTPRWAEREAAGSWGCQQDFVPAAALFFGGVALCRVLEMAGRCLWAALML